MKKDASGPTGRDRSERQRERRRARKKGELPVLTEPTFVANSEEVELTPCLRVLRDGEIYVGGVIRGSNTWLLDTSERLVLTISYGQSNSEAGGLGKRGRHDRIATPGVVDQHRALMLNSGLLGVQGLALDTASLSDLVPAEEDPTAGESGGSAYLRYTLACADEAALPAANHLYRTAGQKGQLLSRLHEGTQPFRNLLLTVARARKLCQHYGQTLWLPHLIWDQGEADRKRGTDADEYRLRMVVLRQRLDFLVRQCTRQQEPVWMLATILVAPGMQVAGNDSAITLAQIAALAAPGIAPICCPYWFAGDYGFSDGQAVHWSPLAKALLREYAARAARIVREAMSQNRYARLGAPIHRRIYEPAGEGRTAGWNLAEVPFETSPRTDEASIVRIGQVITGRVIFAERGLQIMAGNRGFAENMGFEWTGSGSIVAVEVDNDSGRSLWKLTLSAASPGRLSYGISIQKAVFDDHGPQKWGNLFDNCAEPSIAVPGLSLRQGLLPFSVLVE